MSQPTRNRRESRTYLYRRPDVGEAALENFVHAFTAGLTAQAVHYDVVHAAFVRSEIVPPPKLRQCEEHLETTTELVNDLADVLLASIWSDDAVQRALRNVSETLVQAMMVPPPVHATESGLSALRDCCTGVSHIESYETYAALHAHVSICSDCIAAGVAIGLY
jgi:hypothetical protein